MQGCLPALAATPVLFGFHALAASIAPTALAANHSVRVEASHISGKEHTFASFHSPLLSSNLFSFHFPCFVSSHLTPCVTFSPPCSSSNHNRSHSTHQPNAGVLPGLFSAAVGTLRFSRQRLSSSNLHPAA